MQSYTMRHNKVKYSDHWATPNDIYDLFIDRLGYFDPCPLGGDDFDFMPRNKPMFINPPYSDMTTWVNYAVTCSQLYKKHIVLLIPARTDTKYFWKLLMNDASIEFIKGRLKFGNSKKAAPFPSLLVHLNYENT